MIFLIKTSNTKILRELFHRISQHSSKISIQKEKYKIIISSVDNDEKSFVSSILKERFFSEWDTSEESLEVESKNLYNLSKIIPDRSDISLNISEEKIIVTILKDYLKEIFITGKKIKEFFPYKVRSDIEPFFIIKSNTFQNILKDIDSVTDEASITLEEASDKIVFKGKERQIDFVFRLDQDNVKKFSNSSTVKIPIRYLNYFSPLLKEFNEIEVSISKENLMIVRGINERWEFLLMITAIASN